MEVHHHAHTPRQKWTHYLWEFLMLFLAVYLGFLVENLREHKVERRRGHEYIKSFYEDLKTDTAKLNRLIRGDNDKIEKLGSFRSCYDSLLKGQSPASFLVIMKNSLGNNGFLPEKRTSDQLSNAGGYRLLKQEDADNITAYVQRCESVNNFETTAYQQSQDNLRELFNRLIDFPANASLNKKLAESPAPDVESLAMPYIAPGSKSLLNEYFNTLLQYIRMTVTRRNMLTRLNDKAGSLLEFFKKKYGWE